MSGMNKATQSLPNDVKKLQALLVEKDSEIKSLQEKNQYLLAVPSSSTEALWQKQ